jgi:predicted acetyltransferase
VSIEYRHAREHELAEFEYADLVGFAGSTAEATVQRNLERSVVRAEWKLGAFEDGRLVAQAAAFPFVMRWGGREIGCSGVTGVSTLPSHRRRGHVRELIRRLLAEAHEAGQPVAMLWASMAAIYQRFGYGVACTCLSYEFDPALLRFVDPIEAPGRVRLLKATEAVPLMADAYERFAAGRTLTLRRDTPALGDWWHNFVLRHWMPDVPWLIAVYEEAGEPLGYVIYFVQQRPEQASRTNQLVLAKELVWLTPAAHRALVGMLASYDLAGAVRIQWQPADDPLFLHAQEPRWLNARALDGTLLRIVDVQTALEQRGYPVDGRFSFAVADELCPWNAGSWELCVEGGAAAVRRCAAEPQLSFDMRALAMLASGHRPATELARAGMIRAAAPTALHVADALFRLSAAPVCLDAVF